MNGVYLACLLTCVSACGVEQAGGGHGTGGLGGPGGSSGQGGSSGAGGAGGNGGPITALALALEVHSNGTRIGYAVDVSMTELVVYEPSAGLLFAINHITGFVAPYGAATGSFYTQPGCGGSEYSLLGYGDCAPAVEGSALAVTVIQPVERNSSTGFVEPSSLVAIGGTAQTLPMQSWFSVGANRCNEAVQTICGVPIAPTAVIPTAFPTPITVVEP